MKRVALIHEADGQLSVLVEEGADVEVVLVDEAEPIKSRMQVLEERWTRDAIDDAIDEVLSRLEMPTGKKNKEMPVLLPSTAAIDDSTEQIGEYELSDHARLRWLQRVKRWDVTIADREILTPKNRAAIRAGASGLVIGSWWLPIARPHGKIITVMPRDWRPKYSRQGSYGRREPRRESGRKRNVYHVEEA